MRKIHVTRQLFEASGPQGNFFEKTNKNPVFRYGLGECVYQISGQYLFSFWPKGAVQVHKPTDPQTHIFTSENKNILDRMLASRRFWK